MTKVTYVTISVWTPPADGGLEILIFGMVPLVVILAELFVDAFKYKMYFLPTKCLIMSENGVFLR